MDASAAAATMKIENTEKRDVLQATEKKYQLLWQQEKAFEVSAPSCEDFPPDALTPDELVEKVPKYFATMAYPYVNGAPHLGHAFTISKVEFASRVAHAQGKNTLYPQGFHATGMPIKACADRLVNEIELLGKYFDGYVEETDAGGAATDAPATQAREDVTKFTNVKKGKAALKSTKAKYQFQIMLSLGIPRTEIYKFADAQYWLHYFPQLWKQHLIAFGCGVDWRRSFITTEINPYYDTFVRWQMRRLRELGKIRFGKRYTVYSPKDNQPCLDHDRASGEGVLTQEYTALKCRVQKWSSAAEAVIAPLVRSNVFPAAANVYLIAATLRPETMYGQTNMFVSPTITYGIFQVSAADFFVATDRAARNMAFQGIFPDAAWGAIPKVASIFGTDLIGSLVRPPLSCHGDVYVLPMATIKEGKGTGVVTSVPSDSPDDYAMTAELAKKAEFYNINPDWVCTDTLHIISTPDYDGPIAPALVKKMKINSPKDEHQLAEAKEVAYKVGFYQGRMVYGDFTGKSVQEAKPLVRQLLLDSSDAFAYCEPDGLVISRSGDECVAAFLDQWFLTYGVDTVWRDDTMAHLRGDDGLGFNTFTTATKNSLEQTFGWMMEWSVTRQYGLGTDLPWDTTQMVEGLSDSTIYMAYYTFAHYLHGDIYGKTPGLGNIEASQMTDAVWDYVFALADDVQGDTDISRSVLNAMRREFTYWYPLDIRTSGKDLINNHLVFFLYIHQAIWGKKAPRYLPKGIRLNGHLLLNGEKMSKNTGNFLTLESAIRKFGADATRLALADGGDGVDDANFEEATANAAILRLYELRRWVEKVVLEARVLTSEDKYVTARENEKPENADCVQRSGSLVFWDRLFENDMNSLVQQAVQAYGSTNYKAALKAGFFDLTSVRDTYRAATASAGIGMHNGSIRRYVEAQALMLYVVAPHWADYVWREVLQKPEGIRKATFPTALVIDTRLNTVSEYIRRFLMRVRAADAGQQKRMAKGKGVAFDPSKDKTLRVYVASKWPEWQTQCVDLVRTLFDGMTLDTKQAVKQIAKADMKKAMPFVQDLKRRLEAGEPQDVVFDRNLGFDETAVVHELVPVLVSTVPRLKTVEVVEVEGPSTAIAGSAEPGSPALEFVNI